MNKKHLLFIVILMSITTLLFSFDYKSYPPKTLEELVEFISKDVELNKNLPGETSFGEKFRLVITLKEYPTLITKKDRIQIKNGFFKIFEKEYLDLFTYKLFYKYKGQKYIFLFQNNLMKYLPNEAKLNEKIELFTILGIHDNRKNEITVLVNEFNTNSALFGR